MPAFLFGPLGAMVPIPAPRPDIAVTPDRLSTEFRPAGGWRSVMRARHAPRAWSLSWGWKGPDVVSVLTAAAQGLLEACWLYDSAAARENMLAAHQTTGTGVRVKVGPLSLGSVAAGHTARVPVLAGRFYTVSAWSAAAAGTTVATYQLDAGPVVPVLAGGGSGDRYTAAGFEAPADGILTVTVPGPGVSGLRVHDGFPDELWYPGTWSPCKVSVKDPDRVLQLVTDQEVRSSYSVGLLEVGKPGTI